MIAAGLLMEVFSQRLQDIKALGLTELFAWAKTAAQLSGRKFN